jgi:hypothetical protein
MYTGIWVGRDTRSTDRECGAPFSCLVVNSKACMQSGGVGLITRVLLVTVGTLAIRIGYHMHRRCISVAQRTGM